MYWFSLWIIPDRAILFFFWNFSKHHEFISWAFPPFPQKISLFVANTSCFKLTLPSIESLSRGWKLTLTPIIAWKNFKQKQTLLKLLPTCFSSLVFLKDNNPWNYKAISVEYLDLEIRQEKWKELFRQLFQIVHF